MESNFKWPYHPLPGKQTEMWKMMGPDSTKKFVGYGGGRGSGKSFGMRSWFVTACWRWPLKATIIRKSRADLRDNHINPFKAEMRDFIDAGYIKVNERDAAAYFQNGSILKFGYCNKPEDLENIQGQAYDLMGIEESTQLDELYLRKMFAACRGSEISDGTYQNKVLMTFNWGAVSHNYHRRIFWDQEYNEYERPEKYHFIWANLDDNPALLEKTPDYKEQLAATLDEQYRKAWIDGDPDAFSGTVFSITDIAHMVDPADENILGRFGGIVPNNWKIFGSVDVGTTVCAFGLYAKTPGGNLFKMFSYYGEDRNPQDHIEAIVDRIRNFRWTDGRFPSYVLADRRAFAQIGKNQIHSYDTTWEDLFREYGIYLRRANDTREQGFMALKSALGYKYDDENHELITNPKLRFFKGTNKTTVDHLKAMQLANNNKEDIDQNLPDHDYDETRYANMGALTPSEKRKQETKEKKDPQSDYGSNREDHDLLKKGVGHSTGANSGSSWENWFD
jgi:phage terminase large subunit